MRPATPLALSAVLASALLLTGCGTRDADSAGPGSSGASAASGSPTCTPSPPVGDPDRLKRDGVTVLGRGCGPSATATEFEVTNSGSQALTYTINFALMNDAGEAMDSTIRTVASVGPGRTVRDIVDTARTGTDGNGWPRVQITKVRAVPANEASGSAGACPPSGIRVTTDEGDAAMGLRVVGLHLTNCGTGDYRLDGYPQLQLLDANHEPVTGVRILRGTSEISTGLGSDAPPGPVTLKPGESAFARLAWRNTTGFGEAVNAPYARVTARPGATAVTVTPEFDLGTTGKLGTGPWQKEQPKAR
ncbi:DUF4232 domain-containing protein [Streptomyces sp. DT171]|uniref:DUF4232 domain-containing protein n=1 Tax=Streptomyces sp. DT171 TaxID=3416524 RepID=UPI003CF0C998